MTTIVFVLPAGGRKTLDVPDGTSLMQAATSAGLDGIVAECGGAAMCATCHVFFDAADAARLRPMDEVEDALLDSTASGRRPTSRLACQVKVFATLGGLVVHVPETQV